MAWRTGRVRIELNRAGVRAAALTSTEVRAALRSRAELVRDAAQIRYDAISVGERDKGPEGHEPAESVTITAVMVEGGVTRANARILGDHPAALNVEAKHRVLGHSIDAGGD
jgi:hypothetical protein